MSNLQYKHLVVFKAGTDTGVDEIPINSYVQVHNWSGESRLIWFISASGLTGSSTVADMVEDTNYINVHTDGDGTRDYDLSTDPSPSLIGDLDCNDNSISNVVMGGWQNALQEHNTSGTISIDTRNTYHNLVIGGDYANIVFTNVTTGYSEIRISILGNGNTVAFNDVIWEDNEAPEIGSYVRTSLRFITVDSGTTWYGYKDVKSDIGSWDVTTLRYVGTGPGYVSGYVSPCCLTSPDGKIFYKCSDYDARQFPLSTPWDITTYQATTGGLDLTGNGINQMFFSSDGSIVYQRNHTTIYQRTLTTPWDISTTTSPTTSTSGSRSETVQFHPNGTRIYSFGSGSSVHLYYADLSTAWDITTIGTWTQMTTTGTDGDELFIRPDGLAFYTIDYADDIVRTIETEIPWDFTTTTAGDTIDLTGVVDYPSGLWFSQNGRYMYTLNGATDASYMLELDSTN